MDANVPARLRPLRGEIESTLQGGGLLNWDPPNAADLERCLKWLSSDWQQVDFADLNEHDEGMAVAIHSCLKAGFAKMRCNATAHDSDLERTAVFEIQVTGESYRELVASKLGEFWSSYNAHQESNWEVCLTASGAGAKIDVESGVADRCRRACQCAFYLREAPEVRCRLIGKPTTSSFGNAVAVAQANPTIHNHVSVAPTEVNITVDSPPAAFNKPTGPSGIPKRHTEWRKVYEMLDQEGEPIDRDAFVTRYNQNWSNKAIDGRPGERWPRLSQDVLQQRIRDWRKRTQ